MKKFLMALLITALTTAAFAEEGLKIGGEAKSGIFWRESQDDGAPKKTDDLKLHNNDDAGGGQGRFRLNLDYENDRGTGMSARIEWENWQDTAPEKWGYGFAYGNYFDRQLKVSVGKLGGSPWGTGGPEMWRELEKNDKSGGMRVEYKPGFIPDEYGTVNVGFVLNSPNDDRDHNSSEELALTMMHILQESVIGIAYVHPSFLIRLGYRFDSEWDAKQDNKDDSGGEDEFIYRVEERVLKNAVPGLQFSAIGDLYGLTATHKEIQYFRNWGFIDYEPPEMWGLSRPFTAQLRFGHLQSGDADTGIRSEIMVKPSFYWNFFDKLLSIGAAFAYNQDFGKKMTEGSPYQYIQVEPKIQLNLESSYIAFVYCFRREYFQEAQAIKGYDPIRQTQWINLRFCIYF